MNGYEIATIDLTEEPKNERLRSWLLGAIRSSRTVILLEGRLAFRARLNLRKLERKACLTHLLFFIRSGQDACEAAEFLSRVPLHKPYRSLVAISAAGSARLMDVDTRWSTADSVFNALGRDVVYCCEPLDDVLHFIGATADIPELAVLPGIAMQ